MKRITAIENKVNPDKIEQCDVFKDITLVENVNVQGSELSLSEMQFPMAMCINQSCDLESDLRQRNNNEYLLQDGALFHLIMIPVFIAEKFRAGRHWGELRKSIHINSEKWGPIVKNEDPRFHILTFSDNATTTPIPQLVLDFKHFFTISRDYLYSHKDKRLFSIAPLFRERISQRFANYLSRIGLPEVDASKP